MCNRPLTEQDVLYENGTFLQLQYPQVGSNDSSTGKIEIEREMAGNEYYLSDHREKGWM